MGNMVDINAKMAGINAKAEYYKAKNELLQLAGDSVELYKKLVKEAKPENPLLASYRASLAAWCQLLDEL